MSRLDNLIRNIRYTLADPNADRWSNDRLLALIDEAQLDICQRAKVLRAKVSIPVIDGQAEYKLPDDVLLIDRVLLDNQAIELVSHNTLDNATEKWEVATGQVVKCVYDKQNRANIRLYPTPAMGSGADLTFSKGYSQVLSVTAALGEVATGTHLDNFSQDFGVVTHVNSVVQVTQPDGTPSVEVIPYIMLGDYGVTANILYDQASYNQKDDAGLSVELSGYTSNDDFGIITSVLSDDVEYSQADDYGVVSGLHVMSSELTINYIQKPNKIDNINDELQLDAVFDKAIKYYVTAKAFRDDLDAQNRAIGNEEFSLYERELDLAIQDDTKDFTRNNKQYYTRYYNGFD